MTKNELLNLSISYLDSRPEADNQVLTEGQILEIANGVAAAMVSPRDAASGLSTGRTIPMTKIVIRSVIVETVNTTPVSDPSNLTAAEIGQIATSTEMAITEKGIPVSTKPKTK